MSRPKGSKNKTFHKWTEEEKEYLKEMVVGRTYREIQELLNTKFEYQFNIEQIQGAITRYKLTTGLTGQFKEGLIPWNKGKKGYMGANRTSFKKGSIPPNLKKVGHERIDADGYVYIKTKEHERFKLKHRVIYEKYHNLKLNKEDVVIFADGNKRNFDINNLLLVTKQQLIELNRNKLIKEDADLTKVGINIVDLLIKTEEVRKKNKK